MVLSIAIINIELNSFKSRYSTLAILFAHS